METRTYEGMFLLDSTQAAQDWENLRKQVTGMLERRGGEILSAKKWAERKLAYEIKGHKRGTYFLVYFTMAPQNVATLRRDMQLSELVLRNMILVHDKHFHVPEGTENEQEAGAEVKETEGAKKAEEPKKDEEKAEEPKKDEEKAEEPKKDEEKVEEPKKDEEKIEDDKETSTDEVELAEEQDPEKAEEQKTEEKG